MAENCTILIPTHSAYMDICENFISVLRRSWKDCPYPVKIALCGKQTDSDIAEKIYCGESTTLTKALVEAVKNDPNEMFLVFLGDAFFFDKVDQKEVEVLLTQLSENKVQYCSLRPKPTQKKEKLLTELLRQIHSQDRYTHSFICFAATKDYIIEEFNSPKVDSDMDYELKYLQIVNSEEDFYFEDHAILRRDIFHIIPGIEKGKWDRHVLSKLKKRYPDIEFSKREKLSVARQLYSDLNGLLLPLIPNGLRRFLKKIVGRVFGKSIFTTDT